MRNRMSIIINAPPGKVWPYLVEPEKIRCWYFELTRLAYVGNQTKSRGSVLHIEEKIGISTLSIDCIISQYRENESVKLDMVSGDAVFAKKIDQEWRIETDAAGCRFVFDEVIEVKWGVLGKLLELLLKPVMKSNLRKMLTLLKNAAESSV
jgi:hypothetical protein